jgi:hypothetical protein
MTESQNKLQLPRVYRARFRDFTLYNRRREIDLTFPDGVFCLAGANGLGKSTFLLAINYGITGRVPEPDRDFISLEDYYERTEEFSRSFFDGRISEKDRETAEVELDLRVGHSDIRLRRGMFEPEQLRTLFIRKQNGRIRRVKGSPIELQQEYNRQITEEVGLASFEQLVFLQHFVLTFDERRHLLFWQQRELEQTLFLSFGVSSDTARLADSLRDKAQKADSYGRNAVWRAGITRKKVRDLEDAVAGLDEPDDVEAEYKRLQADSDEALTLVTRVEGAYRDANLRFAELSAKQATLRAEYDTEFSKRFASSTDVRHHPLVRRSIADSHCHLCDNRHSGIGTEIEKRVATGLCPICGSNWTTRAKEKDLGRLKDLDKALAKTVRDVAEAFARSERLRVEVEAASAKRDRSAEALERFSKKNRKAIARLEARGTVNVKAVLEEYRRQVEDLEREKRKRYKERDAYRLRLRPIQQRLERQYRDAESQFVPLFRKLAESFLGVDLNVVFELSRTSGATLILDVENGERREFHQLSESQRFFVDIALRMALIKYMSANDSPACLYLDTPEGSLDIAYETRAGQMIAEFIKDGFGCIMTANINTSRLLISLAAECGSANMVLHRMTAWADLTQVQTSEEKLFNAAYGAIEKGLRTKPGR